MNQNAIQSTQEIGIDFSTEIASHRMHVLHRSVYALNLCFSCGKYSISPSTRNIILIKEVASFKNSWPIKHREEMLYLTHESTLLQKHHFTHVQIEFFLNTNYVNSL